MTIHPRTTTRLTVLVGAAALALGGCASDSDAAADGAAAPAEESAATVEVSDAWAKAVDEGMSAAFGEVTNDGPDDVTIVAASTEASAMVELHETTENDGGEMAMSEVEGGFVIPAGQTLTLEPGGNHLMFMDVTEPLEAGAEVTVTLTFADDSTLDVTAPVKDYSGANESYEGGDDMEDMEDMDHEDMDH